MRMRHRTLSIAVLFAACFGSSATTRTHETSFERVRQAALAEIAAGSMPGLAVAIVNSGRVVFAEGFGVANVETRAVATPETVFQAGSAGKMLTAAAVLEAAANGSIRLREPIGRVAKGLDPSIAALTPHQLLSHSSGMRDMPGAHGELGDDAHGRFLRTLTAADRILPPGQAFSYSNIGYSLAGFAVAEASGEDFAAAVTRLVLDPAGMQHTTLRPTVAMTWPVSMGHQKQADGSFVVVRPMAHDARLWPAGYAFTTALDLSRFVIALLGDGSLDGRRVLHTETVTEMKTAHVELPALFDGWRYGYGLFLMPMRGLRVVEHAGTMVGFAALVRLVPDHGFAVIALSNSETPAIRTVDAAMESLLPLEAPKPRVEGTPVAVSAEEMQAFAGRYENRGRFDLTVEHGSLILRQNDGAALPIMKLGGDLYIATGPGNQPRLRFMLKRATGATPATLHFGLWAYPKVTR